MLYSCVREAGGATPSAIMFVEPPKRRADIQLELPRDWVRRHNHAAWLRVMELRDAASRLRDGTGRAALGAGPAPVRFRRIRIEDAEYAVLISLDRTAEFPDSRLAIGIETRALEATSAAIRGNGDEVLGAYRPRPLRETEGRLPLSVLPGGTLFGLVAVNTFEGFIDVVL